MTTEKRFKRGDLHPDGSGRAFWGYSRGTEAWASPDVFENRQSLLRASRERYSATPKGKAVLGAKRAREAEYRATPTGKSAERARAAKCRATPEGKSSACVRHAKYRAKPEKKARMRDYMRGYDKQPHVIAKRKAYSKSEQGRGVIRKLRATPAARAKDREYDKRKRQNDLVYMVRRRVSSRTREAFRESGYLKTKSIPDIIRCDWASLVGILEARFLPGMSWENRDLWHIDHHIPLASAKDADELVKLCHSDNLWPLWAKDNLRKKKRIPDKSQLPLL